MHEPIRSSANPAIKRVRAVMAGREPDTLLLEGDRLLDDALDAGSKFELILVSTERRDRARELRARGCDPLLVEPFLLDRVGTLKHSPGILALAKAPVPSELDHLSAAPPDQYGSNPLVVVAAGVSDPVNLGALVRSAEAAGAVALVNVPQTGVSLWNPRALRGSMGSLLRMPIFQSGDRATTAQKLNRLGFQLVRPATRGGTPHLQFDWSPPIALWIDSETGAVADEARRFAAVSIPMADGVDSLNVTVASAVLMFAAGRNG